MSRCWLTGASSGLGAALAQALLEQGHQVALGGRRSQALLPLAERYPGQLVERVVRTNLLGVSNCLAAALPLLRAGVRPHLVVVGSSVTWLALPRAGAYGASKAAVRYLVESQRIDLAREGIDVTLVSPGFVDTPLTRRNDFPMPQLWSAERAAQHIAKRLPRRPLEINFPSLFTWGLRVLGALPPRLRLALGLRLARHEQD